jgi:hypothetical protein
LLEAEERTKMSPMIKVRGTHQPASEPAIKVRRKRAAVAADPNETFTRAFVDALRDILHDEMRII